MKLEVLALTFVLKRNRTALCQVRADALVPPTQKKASHLKEKQQHVQLEVLALTYAVVAAQEGRAHAAPRPRLSSLVHVLSLQRAQKGGFQCVCV